MNNPFEFINNRLNNLEALVLEVLKLQHNQVNSQTKIDEEPPITVQQAADFLNLTRRTVYQKITKIPHRKRHGRLYFFKSELAVYLRQSAHPLR